MNRRVVVTGLGTVTSLSCQVEDLWQRILEGQSGIHALSRFDTSEFKVRFGGELSDWEPDGYIPP
ncbi:MAG: beta-ketoacyl synthase N-terminal-like domain-containing protein, partial [Pirellulales bacterium]